MLLKELSIKGFKSFLHTTKLTLLPGITAIVGPNGSGKSNISDAIRWVLGENSIKNLRGSRMEDVIFTGTEEQKPVGFAEVSIVFADCRKNTNLPYDEIQVTRRMFRDGESEFSINKNKCRLKDIRELFMDTGIGRDGYSLIGQGQIDEVLSTRPEDRRMMFDEASGIAKLRTKKEEAIRKIERAEEDLLRLRDIFSEIERQYERRKADKEKTERYRKIQLEKQTIEKDVLHYDMKRIYRSQKEAQDALDTYETSVEALRRQREEMRSKVRAMDELIEVLSRKSDEIREQKLQSVQAFSDMRGEYRSKETALRAKLEEEAFLEAELHSLEEQRRASSEELYRIEKQMQSMPLTDDLEKTTQRLKELEDSFASLQEEYESLREAAWCESLSAEDMRRNEMLRLERMRFIQEENRRRTSEIEELKIQSDTVEIELAALKDVIQSAEETLLKGKETVIHQSSVLSEYNVHQQSLIEQKSALEAQRKAALYELDVRNSLLAREDLLSGAVKALSDAFDERSGYFGPLVRHLHVQQDFAVAIETALQSKLQYILTRSEKDAKIMVEFLKNKRAGRATFLPLDRYSEQYQRKALPKIEGLLGFASDFVQTPTPFEAVLSHMLGDAVIYDTLSHAIQGRKKLRVTSVTAEGEYLHASGSITGGYLKRQQETPLRVKEQILRLKERVKEIEEELYALTRSHEDHRKCMENVSALLTSQKTELDTLEMEHTRQLQQRALLCERRDLLQQNLQSKLAAQASAEEEYRQLEERKETTLPSEAAAAFETFRSRYTSDKLTLEASIASEKKRESTLRETVILRDQKLKNISELKRRISEFEKKAAAYRSRMMTLKSDAHLLKVETKRLQETMMDKEGCTGEFDAALNSLADEREELHLQKYALESSMSEIDEQLQQLGTHQRQVSVRIAKMEEQLDGMRDSCAELGIDDVAAFCASVRDVDNIAQKREKIRSLAMAMTELGSINLNALDEYREIEERKRFYEAQIEDIETGLSDLEAVALDIQKEMEKAFAASFSEIRRYFQETFAALFQGGHADIFLVDPSAPLTSGVAIEAQPPGKKTQALSLLSGGEKTLTAIALLFAFLKRRPSPFCILDEIDAALDDANISRYTAYLRTLSAESQFLIITHRKMTLEVADTLYGVSMRQKGISELISMKLQDRYKHLEGQNVSVV